PVACRGFSGASPPHWHRERDALVQLPERRPTTGSRVTTIWPPQHRPDRPWLRQEPWFALTAAEPACLVPPCICLLIRWLPVRVGPGALRARGRRPCGGR